MEELAPRERLAWPAMTVELEARVRLVSLDEPVPQVKSVLRETLEQLEMTEQTEGLDLLAQLVR